jgi:hypothetical protein
MRALIILGKIEEKSYIPETIGYICSELETTLPSNPYVATVVSLLLCFPPNLSPVPQTVHNGTWRKGIQSYFEVNYTYASSEFHQITE